MEAKIKNSCEICDEEGQVSYEKEKKVFITRLNRIEGQIRGIKKLIENDAYCDDVLNQISSAKSALNGVGKVLLEKHMESCVAKKLKKDDPEIIQEFIKTVGRLLK
ncbi:MULTISPECIES: metal-sensitive transcriptional regulator [Psychrilyobacter]|uniref:CsoR family transcriptional regulator n=1 Tax=Psychrilyobacter piezotolerans TaxID=2293438 RepID=A0ABX9KII6_9FUSO|nr:MULTISPECIES: metal-sensitive transcriptional regulator [Psychrilyobacter]MCS5421332.1 metal-sensitive transcriptional regulator [Psychrilyobacter sp. S5]NDI77528.1 metal-sensing transcriptional repressor [Psychrilyobacter piezotolerans]RDE62960.1 CsoR family transcriptional regulator [Psychrilyobacter sp. S5]REI41718.1 CsoR family transcriptional regulator [Psychrilyobacter piezotolerans]